VESVSGGHRLQRHPGGRQSDQVRGGTSGSPNDRPPRHGGLPSSRGPSHRILDLSCAWLRCTNPHNRARDRLRGRPGSTDGCRFVWLSGCSALVGPRVRADPGGPELAPTPLRGFRGGGPRRRLPWVYKMADGPGDPSARGVRSRRSGVGLSRSSRPMNETRRPIRPQNDGRKWTFDRK